MELFTFTSPDEFILIASDDDVVNINVSAVASDVIEVVVSASSIKLIEAIKVPTTVKSPDISSVRSGHSLRNFKYKKVLL